MYRQTLLQPRSPTTPTNNNEKTKQAKENRIGWELETEGLVVKNGGLNEDGLENGH